MFVVRIILEVSYLVTLKLPQILLRKNAKILKFSKSQKKVDLLRNVRYQYNILKLTGYVKESRSLTDCTLWWKTYNKYTIKEIFTTKRAYEK